jgi:hypothetical protein
MPGAVQALTFVGIGRCSATGRTLRSADSPARALIMTATYARVVFDGCRAAAVLALATLTMGGAADKADAAVASGRPAHFTAFAGEHNDLTVDASTDGAVQFSDARALVVPWLWCLPLPPGEALCDPDGDPRDTDGGGVSVDLGDGDDRAIIRGLPRTGARPGGSASSEVSATTASRARRTAS